MAAWDRRSPQQIDRDQEAAARRQVVDLVAPFSPWWRERFAALGRSADAVGSVGGLAGLPAAGERDLCPDGDPRGMGALVLQSSETGFALHAEGPVLRKALLARLTRPSSYRALVEADTRPTSFVWAGLGLRYPVGSTRSDLDLVARCGPRLWQLLGLTRADVVVCGLPAAPSAAAQALQLGALGAGSPYLQPGDDLDDLAAALRLVPATVLALPTIGAADLLDDLDEAGAPLGALTTLLLVGAAYEDERLEVRAALDRVGVGAGCAVLCGHVPDGHRLMWADCRASAGRTGLHTYPDLELVQLVDPETGEQAPNGQLPGAGPLEVVLTQLGFRGTALLRWRTGDLAEAVATGPCEACGRTVARLTGLRPAALVPPVALRSGVRAVDLRAVSAALIGCPEVADWRVLVGPSSRDGADDLLVFVVPAPAADPAGVAVAVARDVQVAAGLLPSQVLVVGPSELPTGGVYLGPRLLTRQ